VGLVVSSTDDEHEITKRVAKRLSELLARGYRLPPEVARPLPVQHMTCPLYIAPDDSWSMASVVWDVGQRTPVHSHETWGVVGIYSGIEHEVRFLKPVAPTAGAALTPQVKSCGSPASPQQLVAEDGRCRDGTDFSLRIGCQACGRTMVDHQREFLELRGRRCSDAELSTATGGAISSGAVATGGNQWQNRRSATERRWSWGRRVATVERMTIERMDHVGVWVDDLAAATAFVGELGLERQGEGPVEGG
jgi:hypothetical protein